MIFRLSCKCDFKYLNQQGWGKGSPLSRTICTLRSFSLTLTAHPNPAPSCTKPLADVSEGFVLKVEMGGAPARWLALGPLVTPPPSTAPPRSALGRTPTLCLVGALSQVVDVHPPRSHNCLSLSELSRAVPVLYESSRRRKRKREPW